MNIKLLLFFIFIHFNFIKNDVKYLDNNFIFNEYKCFSNNNSEINIININTYSNNYNYNVSIINLDTNNTWIILIPDNSGFINKKISVYLGNWSICILSSIQNSSISYNIYMYKYNYIFYDLLILFMLILLFNIIITSFFIIIYLNLSYFDFKNRKKILNISKNDIKIYNHYVYYKLNGLNDIIYNIDFKIKIVDLVCINNIKDILYFF